jgi:hypothetical protein
MIKYAVLGRAAIFASLLSGAMTVAAQAQEIPEAHLTAARQAIASLNVTDRFDNILPNMAEALKGQFIQSSPNFQSQISAIVDEQALALAPRRADLEKEAATIYAKGFSADELKSISTFFNSEAGKKLLTNQPLVNRELAKAAEIWANGIQRDLSAQSTTKLRALIDANPIKTPVAEAAPAAPAPAAAKPTPAKPAPAPAPKP